MDAIFVLLFLTIKPSVKRCLDYPEFSFCPYCLEAVFMYKAINTLSADPKHFTDFLDGIGRFPGSSFLERFILTFVQPNRPPRCVSYNGFVKRTIFQSSPYQFDGNRRPDTM